MSPSGLVSIATVSRVTQPDVVATTTRRKVMTAVERPGYAPNMSAKNPRVRNTRRLIVTVPHITRLPWSTILLGIQDSANREGYAEPTAARLAGLPSLTSSGFLRCRSPGSSMWS
jgi:DNA-binding LacI/PurR family transcriptional regulator